MNKELQQHHVMVLESTHPSGAEEWYCPTCGRRILMQWPPNYKKITLEEGDEYAIHSGGKGGLQMSNLTTEPGDTHERPALPEDETAGSFEDDLLTEEDKQRLINWEKWLEKLDLESRWSKKD